MLFQYALCSNGVLVSTDTINSHNARDCITLQYWVVNLVFRYYVSFEGKRWAYCEKRYVAKIFRNLRGNTVIPLSPV